MSRVAPTGDSEPLSEALRQMALSWNNITEKSDCRWIK
jgi:hypothetical protein